jgi:hypothetical protein
MKKTSHAMNEDLQEHIIAKPKRTRKKKRTKAQEEKRVKLLNHILDKWVCVKQNYGEDDTYLFVLHRATDENSTSKIEQIILSDDPLHDGVYLVTDYDIDMVYDTKTKNELIEFRPKKFDLKVGKYAEDTITETFEDLKDHLVGAKYLTEEEFYIYCQSTVKPPGISEMILEYEDINEESEVRR